MKRSISLFLLAALLGGLVWQTSALAQPECDIPPSPTADSLHEIAIDDRIQFNRQKWLSIPHPKGLGVKAADFDQNGVLDVVVGGNGPSPVRITYLGYTAGLLGHLNNPEDLDQTPRKDHTSGNYGLDVADLNGDGNPDLVVGRRKGSKFPAQNDTVWINDGAGVERFDTTVPIPLHVNMSYEQPPIQASETFGLELAPLGPGGSLRLITVGGYGIRNFDHLGGGNFRHIATYRELDTGGAPTPGVYRNVSIGDVTGDGLLDLVVCRTPDIGSVPPPSDRVWVNQGPYATPQFVLHPTGVDIVRPDPIEYQWRLKNEAGCDNDPSCGTGPPSHPGTFDIALGDLDDDRDLDLVIGSPNARNALYLNDGFGRFGSSNGVADGLPAHLFATPTPDWPDDAGGFAYSEFLYQGLLIQGVLPTGPDKSCFEFRVDGVLFDGPSSPWIEDFDGDGVLDVAFANRNDIQEIAMLNLAGLPGELPFGGFHYLSVEHPAPLVYDHIHYQQPSAGPAVTFKSCVELVGEANDGTSYLETPDLNGDGHPDWIESNFANEIITDEFGGHGDGFDWCAIWFGQSVAQPWDCVLPGP